MDLQRLWMSGPSTILTYFIPLLILRYTEYVYTLRNILSIELYTGTNF